MAEVVRDPMYGLCGENGTPELLELIKRYVNIDPVDISDTLHKFVQLDAAPLAEYKIPPKGGSGSRPTMMTISAGVSVGLLTNHIKAVHGAAEANRALPLEFKSQRVFNCASCGLVFAGTRSQRTEYDDAVSRRISEHAAESEYLTRECPKRPGTRCSQNVQRSNVVVGARIIQTE